MFFSSNPSGATTRALLDRAKQRLRTRPTQASRLLTPSHAAVATGTEKGGARCREAPLRQGWRRGRRGSCRRSRELKRESAWGLDHASRRPRRRADIARHVIGCPVTQETMVQSVLDELASDTRLTLLLGAACSARSRGGEAKGRQWGGGGTVQPGLPVSDSSGWDWGFAGRGRQITYRGCRVGTSNLRVSSRSPDRDASKWSPDKMVDLRVLTLIRGGRGFSGEGGGARARVRHRCVDDYS